jgi:hypothetical protein
VLYLPLVSSFRSRLLASLGPLCKVTETPLSPSTSLGVAPPAFAGVDCWRLRPSGIRQLLAKLASAPGALRPSPPGLVTLGGALVDNVLFRLRLRRTLERPSVADAVGEGVAEVRDANTPVARGDEDEDASEVAGNAMSCGGTGEPCNIVSSARAVVATPLPLEGEAATAYLGNWDTAVDGLEDWVD